jgi:hypothetical protein|nr:MAG TPA: phosphodiesterase [Caudoviricetes sp.]
MAKVTSKNTKDQILEAYNEAQEEIKRLKEGKTTTAEVVKAKEIKEVKAKAKEIIDLDILNDDMKDKYTALLKTVDLLEEEIEELYGIKKEADSLEALINAGKDKDRELDARYAARVDELNSNLADKKAEVAKAIKELNDEYDKLKSDLRAEYQEEKVKLQKERDREKEEFEYNLKRERQKDNDAWEDEKASRESVLAEKEIAVAMREANVDEKDAKITELNEHIADLNDKIEEIKEASFKEGRDKASKEFNIQKSYIEKEAKWAKERLEEKIASLEEALSSEKAAHEITKTKLDTAYAKVQEIATQTVQANGSVKIVESSKN